jgi:hypothetical protein
VPPTPFLLINRTNKVGRGRAGGRRQPRPAVERLEQPAHNPQQKAFPLRRVAWTLFRLFQWVPANAKPLQRRATVPSSASGNWLDPLEFRRGRFRR